MKRPKRIKFHLVDDFTGASRMIYDSPYCPVKDGLRGNMRRFITKMIESYKKERRLHYHSPLEFPSTQHLKIEKIF